MHRFFRFLRLLVSIAIAIGAGTLPACGSMGGGGGMHYFVEPPAFAAA